MINANRKFEDSPPGYRSGRQEPHKCEKPFFSANFAHIYSCQWHGIGSGTSSALRGGVKNFYAVAAGSGALTKIIFGVVISCGLNTYAGGATVGSGVLLPCR